MSDSPGQSMNWPTITYDELVMLGWDKLDDDRKIFFIEDRLARDGFNALLPPLADGQRKSLQILLNKLKADKKETTLKGDEKQPVILRLMGSDIHG